MVTSMLGKKNNNNIDMEIEQRRLEEGEICEGQKMLKNELRRCFNLANKRPPTGASTTEHRG